MHLAFFVVLAQVAGAVALAWWYWQRYQMVRPPIGVLDLSDVALMLAGIVVVPWLYLALPLWMAGTMLALGIAGVLACSIWYGRMVNMSGMGAIPGRATKRTYALPTEMLSRFEAAVAPGKRSAVLAEIMGEWLAERDRETLRRDIAAGCEAMADVYREIEQEFNAADEELHRAVEA